MKKFLSIFFLLIVQFIYAQSGILIKVPGTKCSLLPPKNFTPASSFSGFQHIQTGSSIMINEIPAPYQSIVGGFTAQALQTRGMSLIDKKEIDFNTSKATLIHVTQPANGTTYIKHILIFGDVNHTVMVNGIYPQSAKDMGDKIKESILSTVYNSSQNENTVDAASFSVDVSDTEFKMVKYVSGSLLYSTDGKIATESPTLIVSNSIAKINTENQKKYAEERFRKLPNGEKSSIRQVKGVTIDKLDGYEIIADGKTKNDTPELVYFVMLFNANGDYYLIVGKAKEDFEKNLTAYKKIANTFRLK